MELIPELLKFVKPLRLLKVVLLLLSTELLLFTNELFIIELFTIELFTIFELLLTAAAAAAAAAEAAFVIDIEVCVGGGIVWFIVEGTKMFDVVAVVVV